MHAPVITEQITTDAESAQALLASAYAEGRVRFETSEDFRFGQRRQDLGELRIDDMHYSFYTEYQMSPLGYALIVRVLDGELGFEDAHRDRRLFRAGDVFMCAQPDEPYRAVTRTRRAQAISLDLSLVDEVSEEPAADVVRRFTREALRPEQAGHWRRTVDYLTQTLAANDTAASSPLVLGAAGRLLAAATVTAFTPGALPRPSEHRSGIATVRRAVAFMEANPDLDLSVTDIAAAAHVSVRALQIAFRRHLDATPMGYLRRVRLDRVRADLHAADPTRGVTVTDIAARWGFADLSRFSAHYRRMFGELPRDTLRG
ncbi:helix-turn-helix transcriptional regulator [Nocardioides sp. BP30]|uniref:helix-turn-helix transcriptional regulator n=1 Tax=Nocardioides sp. BP30 TaxID=3036374 RepID=UPI002469789D|nr:helix-turn-helix transcriptional regulator [Nocardioides sp. BP30]WGL51781.1 helix-turn-helix transcriptional regulator [Nocardioides sp. BP30]